MPSLLPVIRDSAVATPDLIATYCRHEWIGQPWLGYARIAVAVRDDGQINAVNDQGGDVLGFISARQREVLREHFTPSKSRNAYFALRGRKLGDPIWIVDCLRNEGVDLNCHSFDERWKMIPKSFIAAEIKLAMPLRTTVKIVEAVLRGKVLLRNPRSMGFSSSSTLMLRGPSPD